MEVLGTERQRRYAKESLVRGVNNKRHICETLRMICDEVYDEPDNEVVMDRLVDAMIMAKKMQARLVYYQKTYEDNTGNKAKDIMRLAGNRKRSTIRKARML